TPATDVVSIVDEKMKCYSTHEVLFVALSILSLPGYLFGQDKVEDKVLLYQYNQSDSVTSCQIGLIYQSDKLVVQGLANFSGENDLLSSISLEILKQNVSKFEPLCFVYPNKGCNGFDGLSCYCQNTTQADVFHFFVNQTAITAHSHAKLRAFLSYTNGSRISSNEIHLPGIYDPLESTKTRISVNGEKVESGPGECTVVIYRSQLSADYWCHSPYSPCWLEVSLNGSVQTPQQNTSHVHFEAGHYVQNYSLVIFKQSACRLGEHEKVIQCFVLKEIDHDSSKHLIYVGYFFAVFIPLTLVIVLCCVAIRVQCWRRNACLVSCFAKFFHQDIRPKSVQGQKFWAETTPFELNDGSDEF
ncbi:polymorphic transmembrane cluster 2 transmembrane protein 4, partial [Biomphalaria glabrata]